MARSPSPTSHRLANQILEFVREARFEPGHHLREQQFADLLGVSRTPVRMALKLLASEGIAEARSNRGYFLVKPFDSLQRVQFDVAASHDDVLYEKLVSDRLAGKIGTSLMQTEISKRYGVDRLVLLRTLARMAEDGLVERNKGHGWTFLAALDSSLALRAGYQFRLMIEPQLFVQPGFQPDRTALERSRQKHVFLISHRDIAAVESKVLFETDAEFHEMFATFSGNGFVIQAVQQQNRLRRLLEFSGYSNRRRVRDWCTEHLAIIEAVSQGKLVQAGELMRKHLSRADDAADLPAKAAKAAAKPTKRQIRVAA